LLVIGLLSIGPSVVRAAPHRLALSGFSQRLQRDRHAPVAASGIAVKPRACIFADIYKRTRPHAGCARGFQNVWY
jgi:hypothetical protein